MHIATAHLKSATPYSQSRHIQSEKLSGELPDDFEKRTWRERLHCDEKGLVFINPMAFKNNIAEAAKFLSLQVKGKGMSTWTKHFEAGVMVLEGLSLGVHRDEVQGEWLFVPADGKRGGGKRVMRCFPVIPSWSGVVQYHVLDDKITAEIFEKHLREAGNLIGIGRFRPRNNGYYGRFVVEKFSWS